MKYMFPVLWTEFAIMLYPGHGLVIMCFVYIIPSLGYSTGTLMKENAEREELADKYAKCTRRARAAKSSLRTSRSVIMVAESWWR